MTDTNGWVKINRNIQSHWIWKDPVKLKCWLDILFTVNFEDKEVNIGNEIFICKRGESLLSTQSWAEHWRMSKSAARNFLFTLAKAHMITLESCSKTTRLTVCNYDSYQTPTLASKPRENRVETARHTQLKNIRSKEGKNNIKFISAPNLEEVIKYFTDNQYPEWLATKAFNHYNVADWHNSQGKQVKNWKQTMVTNWFKEEHKQVPVIEERKMVY